MSKKTINEEVARMRKIMGLNEMYDDQEDLNDPAYDPWVKGGKYPVYETEPGNAYKDLKRPTGINLDEYFDEVDATTPYGAENGVDPDTVDGGGTNVFMAEKHLSTNDDHDQFEKQMIVQNFLNMLDSNVHELDMLKNIMYERGLYNNLLKYKSGKLKDGTELFGEIKKLVEMLELPEHPNVKTEMLQLLSKLTQPEMAMEPVAETAEEVSRPDCGCEEMAEIAATASHNQPDYTYYVINKTMNKIITGFSDKEDAVSRVKEMAAGGDDPKNYVVSSLKYAKMRGLDPQDNNSWAQ